MAKDQFTREWIIEKGIPIVQSYSGNLTIRALHYRLVSIGMTNTMQHYKRVVAAMGVARWNGEIGFDAFKDHDRQTLGSTKYEETDVDSEVESSIGTIEFYLDYYAKNRWENQPIYPEVFIEKKALQGVFERPCENWGVALNPCKGYPSLTYLHDAANRFQTAIDNGKEPIILYFGDYDPSGEDIPRSIASNLFKMTGINIEVKRIALMEEQVVAWGLPPAPAKKTDSRTANWDGLGQVELDAVEPKDLVVLVEQAIEDVFDRGLYDDLQRTEAIEKRRYVKEMKRNVIEIFGRLSDEDEEE